MNSILTDEWFLSILPKTKERFPRKFDEIFQSLESLQLSQYIFCETGCIRSLTQFDWQGNFTILANRFTELHGGKVYTVNIDIEAVELCRNLKNVIATCDDSVSYLSKLIPIDSVNFFYLDSLDIDFNNPIPSIDHHYNEFSTIIKRRGGGNFFVCIDDNVNETIQKGYKINQLFKSLGIDPIIDSYQSLYWVSDETLTLVKNNV